MLSKWNIKYLKPDQPLTGISIRCFIERYEPNTTEEKFGYAEIEDNQLEEFKKHFRMVTRLANEDEYPSSQESKESHRIHKFMLIRPRH